MRPGAFHGQCATRKIRLMLQDVPELVELHSGPARLGVSPAAGGSITRYASVHNGVALDWLRPAEPGAILNRSAGGMSSFPMIPFSNRIRDAAFRFRGRNVQLPRNFQPEPHAIHGHAWREPWSVASRSDTTATLEFQHPAGSWPWSYRAEQTFTLTPERLTVHVSVTNESSESMPVGFGLHPYYLRTPRVRLYADVGQMWEADADLMPLKLVAPPAPLAYAADGLSPDATILDNNFIGFRGRARVEWPEWDAALDIAADPVFSCLVIYTPEQRDFFCAEPATNCIDGFNLAARGRTDTGIIALEPGDTAAGLVTFSPVLGL